ncbi:MAG: alcohol dehydrogenase catalytic domain-containing protein [Myxococcales bacterium]|nr:alcohol dehydrogenase catalytic domain-containing protein [Myxococcales bacterium]
MLCLRASGPAPDGEDSPRTVELTRVPVPVPGKDEALVRVRLAGICNTDLEILRGYMAFSGTLGHEFVGEVVAPAASSEDAATSDSYQGTDLVGARVVGEINATCGTCQRCLAGHPRHCEYRSVLGIANRDGCFAEYLTLPWKNLYRVPDHVSDEVACFAEPVAAAFEILEQLPQAAQQTVAVLGDGKLGLLIAQVLASAGARTHLLGRHARKLALARARGVETPEDNAVRNGGYDLVVEATGSAGGMARALELVRPRGTLVLKSTYHDKLTLDATKLVIDEITLLGSRCGPFAPALAALADGRVDPAPMIDATLPLADGPRAFELARSRGALKVLLSMGNRDRGSP